MNDNKSNHLKLIGSTAAGNLPLPKLEDEATSLLVACNSIMNGLALQGIPLPPRLLQDLTLFCREYTGFAVPFPILAMKVVDCGQDQSPFFQLQHLGHAYADKAKELSMKLHNLTVKADVNAPGHEASASDILELLGDLELQTERIQAFFGWGKLLVRTAARNKLDQDGVIIER